jgi:glyoxylate reductase
VGSTKVDEEFLNAAPNLRVVALQSVGYDIVDVPACTARGVAVCNTPGVLTAAVAETTAALMLCLSRRIPEQLGYARHTWDKLPHRYRLGVDLAGRTLGIIGFGRIGRAVATRMNAFGMRIIWHDVFDQAPDDAPEGVYRPLDDLLREADFVSIHTDLNPGSRHLIGARELGLMKSDAYLINTARGGMVDQPALTQALRDGKIAGAGLDVVDPEPPQPDEPLLAMPNAIVLPHLGSGTRETRLAMCELAVDNCVALLSGQRPKAIVNPEVLA